MGTEIQELIVAIREQTQELRALREELRPELRKTEAIRRRRAEQEDTRSQAKSFLKQMRTT